MNRQVFHLLLPMLGFVGLAMAGTLADPLPSKTVSPLPHQAGSADRHPPAPTIKLNIPTKPDAIAGFEHSFPFKDHHVNLTVLTGEDAWEKDWLIQTRLDTDLSEWSTPASRRSFEFTNLSEGNYRFEARAINSSGVIGEISHVAFTIQPPWYRTKWCYAGYIAGFVLVLLGFFRLRDRRTRMRNQELKILVEIQTKELIKTGAAKDEFLAAISHEIRNPVNGIIGIAESIRMEGLDPDSRHKLGLLRQCSKHLSSLLEDILDFSRFQPDTFKLDSKLFEIAELLESVVALTAAESEKRKIPVEVAISPAVSRQFTGDPRRIRQILINYVTNALKYSDRGKVSVTVWRNKANPGSTEIFFAVCDEGPGIPVDEQKNLFTRFERSASAQTSAMPGTGLGLFICKALAEKMGGHAWMKSTAGKGTCFYFSAILATVEDDKFLGSSHEPIPANLKSALVVDDEEYNRIALTGLLESLGLSVFTAAGERDSITLAENRAFDLIFIDYSIPGLDGPAIARCIRALPGQSGQAMIFATTAFNTPDKRASCLASGMNAFLSKPITIEHLRLALTATAKFKETPFYSQPIPADPLVNLRLLAIKKAIPFKEELVLYLSELEGELKQLVLALHKEDSGRASYYAHLLYGRCSFINERDFEITLRQIETTAATECWDEARDLGNSVQLQFTALRLRLFSDNPVVLRE